MSTFESIALETHELNDFPIHSGRPLGFESLTGLWSDEPEMESDAHLWQIMILLQCLTSLWTDRDDYYAGGNMSLYYSPQMVKNREFRGPDFMVVLDVENYPRKSWTAWEEGWKFPNLIIEILSDSTAKVDRTTKKDLYAELGVEEYFWFDPVSLEFVGHRLNNDQYERIPSNDRGHCWSETLDLWLGRSKGKLRYFLEDGQLLPTPQEATEQAKQERDQAILRGDQAILRGDRLAQKLRELGIDPDRISE